MILAAHQPAYLPWPGYLARIAAADIFVILDNVPFEKDGFTHRNRIKTQEGEHWLTIPVCPNVYAEAPIYDMKIDHSQDWNQQHAQTIEKAYGKSNGQIEKITTHLRGLNHHWLSPLCRLTLDLFLSEYGINTRIQVAPIKKKRLTGASLILELCAELGADTYLSDPSDRVSLDLSLFEQAGVKVVSHDWQCPVYPQLHGPFIPNLSVVDLWLNTNLNPFSSLLRPQTMKPQGEGT